MTWQVERAVARAAQQYRLWSPGATVIVGVSGGADSLCLLGTLHALVSRRHSHAPGHLIVAHLDHGLRHDAGVADAEWVRAFGERLGYPVVIDHADVPALARAEKRSLEDAARLARYTFLRRVRSERNAERICVGHTSDDQLETLVMNWLRGSGLAGLRGMTPLNNDVARPLLHLTRAQTVAYCAAQRWEHREDSSNADPRFLRNRVRRELLPTLRAYNPNLAVTLQRNAALLADDSHYLESVAEAVWREHATVDDGVATLALDDLRDTPSAIRHRLFQRACAHLTGVERLLEATHVLALDKLVAHGSTSDEVALPGQLRARRDYGTLLFERRAFGTGAATEEPPVALRWRLQAPGSVDMPEIGWRLRAWHAPVPPGHEQEQATPSAVLPFSRRGTAAELRRAELRVYVDAEKAGDVLDVRLWQPGDRFQPLGTPFEKKIQDFFVDAKVPRQERRRIPLIFGRGRLVWLGGQRIDDHVKLSSATQRVLALQLEPLTSDAADRTEGDK